MIFRAMKSEVITWSHPAMYVGTRCQQEYENNWHGNQMNSHVSQFRISPGNAEVTLPKPDAESPQTCQFDSLS